ncbi:MAG: KH domain-containing protein [Actinobacteria bacterium]|nr:KH domain-containing protein [Actinomycetota bacterium]
MSAKGFLEYTVPWLVDSPDEVEITEIEGEAGGVVYELTVAPEDMGKVIGKRGRIIRSLRTIARAAEQEGGRSVSVEVVD